MVLFDSIQNDPFVLKFMSIAGFVLVFVILLVYLDQKTSYANLCKAYCVSTYDTEFYQTNGRNCLCQLTSNSTTSKAKLNDFRDVNLSEFAGNPGNFTLKCP